MKRMVDYIKLVMTGIDIHRLSNLHCLDFKLEVSEKTGIISQKKIAKYHGCKILIYDSGIVIFSGSIHKLYNSLKGILAPNYNPKTYKGYNGNQFILNQIVEVKNHLKNLFDCEPDKMQIRSIEIGVNVEIPFKPDWFIRGLLYHKNKSFEYKYDRSFAIAIHDRYNVKIYDKSKQYGIEQRTLRFELKFNKMGAINSIGINTFSDINQKTMKKAFSLVMSVLDEVVYYDITICKDELSKRINLKLKDYSNPRYWIDVLEPRRRDRPKKELKRIIDEYSMNLKAIIEKEISENCVTTHRLL